MIAQIIALEWAAWESLATIAYAVITLGAAILVVQQIRATRKQVEVAAQAADVAKATFEGQTLLALVLQLQAPEARAARGVLYDLVEDGGCTPEQMADLRQAPNAGDRRDAEPAMQILDVLGVMLAAGQLPSEPIFDAWGGMIARCWCASENYVRFRRVREGRPDFWRNYQNLGEECVELERAKVASDDWPADAPAPKWLTAYDDRAKWHGRLT